MEQMTQILRKKEGNKQKMHEETLEKWVRILILLFIPQKSAQEIRHILLVMKLDLAENILRMMDLLNIKHESMQEKLMQKS